MLAKNYEKGMPGSKKTTQNSKNHRSVGKHQKSSMDTEHCSVMTKMEILFSFQELENNSLLQNGFYKRRPNQNS